MPVLVLRVRGFRKELENTDLIVKIVNTTQNPQEADFVFDGIKLKPYSGNSECISSTNLDAVNSFSNPSALKPIAEKMPSLIKNKLHLKLEPYSVNVFRYKKS